MHLCIGLSCNGKDRVSGVGRVSTALSKQPMSSVLRKLLPKYLQGSGSHADLESTWAQQDALPPCVPADSLLTETRVGPYEVLRRLGDGEFSTVVECRAGAAPETYALKVIGKAKVLRPSSVVKSIRGEPRGDLSVVRRDADAVSYLSRVGERR